MNPQEAQQEQTLAEIRAIRNGGEYPREYYREAIDKALVLIHSQAQKIAEQAKEFESAKSLAGIATKRYFEAKQNAEKYRNAYVEESARNPKSMIQAELLPWERWDNEAKKIIDLTEITDSRRFISSSLWKKKYPLRICRRLWMQTRK